MTGALSESDVTAFTTALPADSWTRDRARILPHLVEWRGLWQGRTPLLLLPKTTAEVAMALRIAHARRIPVVPQGGNTGLVGGGVPDESGRAVLLSTRRLRRIRRRDRAGRLLVAEAGVTLLEADTAAAEMGLRFPLSIASGGSATVGGAIATNAGGVHVLRFGGMRALTLGLEAVLADGTVIDELRRVHKDNTGYALTPLLVGSEGTLAVVTAAVLRLVPRPRDRVTALVAVPSLEEALALFGQLAAGLEERLEAIEFIPRFGLELVLRHIPATRDPFAAPHPAYLLIEATGSDKDCLHARLEQALAAAMTAGIIRDAVLAKSETERSALWRLRESLSEAQKKEGASIKHDVALPLDTLAAFLDEAEALIAERLPGARTCIFGHLGDGSLHLNIQAPADADDEAARLFLDRWKEIQAAIHDLVAAHGGSIAAEHGIGRLKRGELARLGDPGRLKAMRALKQALDPHGILNPGVLITQERP